jgi:hypothetical protein
MKLSAPKQITWIVALILGVVGILASQGAVSIVTASVGVWLLVVAWALLLLGALLRGL